MSQHDQVIDNGSGLSVRTDINAALAALFSSNAGPIEPGTLVPGQVWFDTAVPANCKLWIRNNENTAWSLLTELSTTDIGFGKRATPDRFVWNDKADMSGTDVAALTDTGNFSILGTMSFNNISGVASAQFPDADLGMGVRKATTGPVKPNRFVWNSAADMSGTDIASLDEAGNFAVTGAMGFATASFATADMSITSKASPARITFNNGLTGAGTDVVTIDDAGNFSTNGHIYSGGSGFISTSVNVLIGNNGGTGAVYLRPGGVASAAGQFYVSSGTGDCVAAGNYNTVTGNYVGNTGGGVVLAPGTAGSVYLRPNGAASGVGQWIVGSGGDVTQNNGAYNMAGAFTATGSITSHTQGYKPGGGAWIATSDNRVKTVSGDYETGLDAVLALHPVRYTFKGNDTLEEPRNTALKTMPEPDGTMPEEESKAAPTVPYVNSPHYQQAIDGEEFIGLVAQEVEPVMPEMVIQQSAFIDGVAVSDLRQIDTAPLVLALINAVKTLNARIEALEGA